MTSSWKAQLLSIHTAGIFPLRVWPRHNLGQERRYCHYVAGVVGLGLSRLWSASQWERPDMAEQDALSNHMGLFLQKTNIIRDYLEDISEVVRP